MSQIIRWLIGYNPSQTTLAIQPQYMVKMLGMMEIDTPESDCCFCAIFFLFIELRLELCSKRNALSSRAIGGKMALLSVHGNGPFLSALAWKCALGLETGPDTWIQVLSSVVKYAHC